VILEKNVDSVIFTLDVFCDAKSLRAPKSEMEIIFDKCKECCRSALPTFDIKYKRTVFIGLFYVLIFIDLSASVIRCRSDLECPVSKCCVGSYHENKAYTRCKPKLKKDNVCSWNTHKKFILLPDGRYVPDRCGCDSQLTCKQIERKNWKKKEQLWSSRKKRIKTKYKYRCKYIPPEPLEQAEWLR